MEELLKQIAELRKTIEALEGRIAKLETCKATPQEEKSAREVITGSKYVKSSNNTFLKTSKNRVLVEHGYCNIANPEFQVLLKQVLIEINEEDAIDFSDIDPQFLKMTQINKPEVYKRFMRQIARLASKYGANGSLPALLPNDAVLYLDGHLYRTGVSHKAIKF